MRLFLALTAAAVILVTLLYYIGGAVFPVFYSRWHPSLYMVAIQYSALAINDLEQQNKINGADYSDYMASDQHKLYLEVGEVFFERAKNDPSTAIVLARKLTSNEDVKLKGLGLNVAEFAPKIEAKDLLESFLIDSDANVRAIALDCLTRVDLDAAIISAQRMRKTEKDSKVTESIDSLIGPEVRPPAN